MVFAILISLHYPIFFFETKSFQNFLKIFFSIIINLITYRVHRPISCIKTFPSLSKSNLKIRMVDRALKDDDCFGPKNDF